MRGGTNRFQHFQVLNLGMKGPRGLLPFGKFHLLPLSGLTEVFDLLSYSFGRTKDLSAVLLDAVFVCFYRTVQLVLGKYVNGFFKVTGYRDLRVAFEDHEACP